MNNDKTGLDNVEPVNGEFGGSAELAGAAQASDERDAYLAENDSKSVHTPHPVLSGVQVK